MTLVEVTNKQTETEFLQLPVRLYKEEQNWIRPMDKDIKAVFDPSKNKNFKSGEAIRWLLKDDSGLTIGRIAAFINEKQADKSDEGIGGIGFFECIDDQEAAFKLFDTATDWLKEREMEGVDGPINFGDRLNWWGLLVEGFYEPNYQATYNFPYYQRLFETYGFQTYFKQFTFKRPMGSEVDLSPHFYEKAEEPLNDPDYEFRHIKSGEFAKSHVYFHKVYNKAWAGTSGVKPMTLKQAERTFNTLKPVADKRLMWFAFYKGDPVAFFISIPEINQINKRLNGQWNLWSKLKFLYLLKTGKCKKGLGIVFGVTPDHQKKGVEGALVISYVKKLAWRKGFPYNDIEINWIGDFNPKMIKVIKNVGGTLHKTHITYRKLFDETREFKRVPINEYK